MERQDIDDLLKESLSGDLPAAAFRAQVLRDSMAAFLAGRRTRTRRRWAALGIAAGFIVAASFLLGRWTRPASMAPLPSELAVDDVPGRVTVSSDMVAWLEAANLFRQLGMEDRMARAVDRAGRLRVSGMRTSCEPIESMSVGRHVAGETERPPVDWIDRLGARPPGESMKRIMAQSLGE